MLAIVACSKEPSPSGGGGNISSGPKPPTGVIATREGSMIKVSWNSVSNAKEYKLYRSSGNSSASSDGSYTWINSTTATYCYDEHPDHINFYRVTTVDNNGRESEMSGYTGYTF